uniref:Carboxylesterase type B domain-containing protein n=1 Tax=Vombatus ursinus TaxID=29139 RepID=A0A4X2KV84_VOMUR
MPTKHFPQFISVEDSSLKTQLGHWHHADDLIRTTEYGQIQGTQISIKGIDKVVNVFLGIPFAKPPVGSLRFSPPQSLDSWSNVRDATTHSPVCLQDVTPLGKMAVAMKVNIPIPSNSEDRLYLNIYVPDHTKDGDRLPVTANLSACDRHSSASMVQCLRNKSEGEILAITKHFKIIPVAVDGQFLPKHPEELLAAGEFHHVPSIIGVNNHEYGWLLPFFILKIFKFLVAIRGIPPKLGQLMIEEYLRDTEDPGEYRAQFQEIMGDFLFVIPSLKVAKYQHSHSSPVYFYEFQHRPSVLTDVKPDFVKADHGDELPFVFGTPLLGEGTEEEQLLSHRIMNLIHWPVYDQKEEYLPLNLQLSVGKSLRKDKWEFWTKTLPQKMKESQPENARVEL